MPTVETVRGPVELSDLGAKGITTIVDPLLQAGVTQRQIDRMLIANPVAYFTKAA